MWDTVYYTGRELDRALSPVLVLALSGSGTLEQDPVALSLPPITTVTIC